jgi:hypothetical protein
MMNRMYDLAGAKAAALASAGAIEPQHERALAS